MSSLKFALTSRGLDFHMDYCRKIYSSTAVRGNESEIVDLLSSREQSTVFASHYFKPSLDYRENVLTAPTQAQARDRAVNDL